jgi:type VII secretion protein EccE
MVMTQGPVEARPAGGSDRNTLVPRRVAHRRPGISLAVQVMLVQAALAGAVAVAGRAVWLAGLADVLILPVLLLILGRARGHSWLELLALRWRYHRRRAASRAAADPRLSGLAAIAPNLSLSTVEHRGRRIGIGHDDEGWFAGIAVLPQAGVRGDAAPPLKLGTLIAALGDRDAELSAIQLLVHTVPASASMLTAGQQPATASYWALTGQASGLPPVDRTSWIVARLDPAAAADAIARHGDIDGVSATLTSTVTRIARVLERVGLSHQIFDGDGLLAALLRSWGTDASAPGQAREEWNACHTPGLAHATFWIRDLPAVGALGTLIEQLGTAPSLLTSVSLTLEPQLGSIHQLDIRCLVRIAAEPAALPRACDLLQAQVARLQTRLTRLDGEQAPAAYATAPTGGAPR